MRTQCLGVAALVLGLTKAAGAQTCLGTATFASGLLRADGAFQFTAGGSAYGGGVAAGTPSGPFVGGVVSHTSFENIDGDAIGFTAHAGYAVNLAGRDALQVCPLVSFNYQSGPDFTNSVGSFTSSSHAFAFGAALGSAVVSSPGLSLVPFAAISRQMELVSQGGVSGDFSASQAYYNIQIGAGLVIDRTITMQPAVSLPAGLTGGRPTYVFGFSINFGRAK